MSSASSPNLPPAPWKSTFQSHIRKLSSPTFVLSTLARSPANSQSPIPYEPRARYVVFRGFWSELPENKHNTAERNPKAYESEMPVITTDVRMEKVGELFDTAQGGGKGNGEETKGTGGGGPVEAVWWIEEVGAQWRMKGKAYVVCKDDIEEGAGDGTGGQVETVKNEVGKRMRVVDREKAGEWSWKKEVVALFGNHSPALRGSFRAPPPGQPVSLPFNASELALGQKVETNDDPVALRNFRVVIILPDSVEHTDLSDPQKARRHLYTLQDGQWKTEELWP